MDDLDLSQEKQEKLDEARLRKARALAQAIPEGEPGECEYCGGHFVRLVNGVCGRCRDEFKLP